MGHFNIFLYEVYNYGYSYENYAPSKISATQIHIFMDMDMSMNGDI